MPLSAMKTLQKRRVPVVNRQGADANAVNSRSMRRRYECAVAGSMRREQECVVVVVRRARTA